MRVTVALRSLHSRKCGEAVAAGLRRQGHDAWVAHNQDTFDTPVVACWGWRQGQEIRRRGHDVLVMERGYVGNRFEWFSLGWNGLNGRATPLPMPQDDGERFQRHHKALLQPWRAEGSGEYVLLVGQVPGDMSLAGKDLTHWYSNAALTARVRYDKPVMFREHPVAIERGVRRNPNYTLPFEGTLDEALAGAAACVTFNSNTAVDAVLAGVPTTVDNRGSMAWDVAAHRLGDSIRPDRRAWASNLAWRQWKLDEIARGIPFVNMELPK